MTVEEFQPAPIQLTAAAIQRVSQLIEQEQNDDLKLRVFVTGGGCSGFQYNFTLDELQAEDDTRVDKGGVSVLIDPLSYPYLAGGELDYQEGLEGARFLMRNPNAASTCGCGDSFAI